MKKMSFWEQLASELEPLLPGYYVEGIPEIQPIAWRVLDESDDEYVAWNSLNAAHSLKYCVDQTYEHLHVTVRIGESKTDLMILSIESNEDGDEAIAALAAAIPVIDRHLQDNYF